MNFTQLKVVIIGSKNSKNRSIYCSHQTIFKEEEPSFMSIKSKQQKTLKRKEELLVTNATNNRKSYNTKT